MRKTQTNWRRCWSKKWLRKFIAINVATSLTICGMALPSGWAAAGGKQRPPRTKASEKVARKIDDAEKAESQKSLPKTVAENHPLKPCLAKAEASLQAIKAVKDYSALLYKQELIQNKLVSQTMITKVRHEPFSIYLKFDQPHAGREVIYVDGLNKGKLLAHDAGFRSLAGTVQFLPTSKEALAENRHPITQAGMLKMLEIVIEQWQSDAQYQEVQVKESNANVGNEPCRVIETTHPQSRDYFKFHKTRLYLHNETKLPIRVEQFAWPEKDGGDAVLVEEYTYTQIKANLGLTDTDFDKTNPAYQF